jgi:hypothetical protein
MIDKPNQLWDELFGTIADLGCLPITQMRSPPKTHTFMPGDCSKRAAGLFFGSGFGFEAFGNLHPVALKRLDDLAWAFKITPEHWATAIDWPAIAIYPNDIDVGRALRLALFEDQIALINHWIECALDNLLIAYFALGEVRFGTKLFDNRERFSTRRTRFSS